MSAIDAGVVFLPRFTTLVGATVFRTSPLDVSRQGGVQFQVWRGPIRTSTGTGTLSLELEESLDARTWSLGASSSSPSIALQEDFPHFFSYSFRLKWFRLKFTLGGTGPMVSCWAEGLLRGGGEGMWGGPTIGDFTAIGPGGVMRPPAPGVPGRPEPEWWRTSPPSGQVANMLYWSDPAYRAWVDEQGRVQQAGAFLAANQYRPAPPGSVPGAWMGPGSTGPFPPVNPGVSNPFGP